MPLLRNRELRFKNLTYLIGQNEGQNGEAELATTPTERVEHHFAPSSLSRNSMNTSV